MRPAGNYVLLDVQKKKDTSSIITIEKYRKNEPYGTILAIGAYVSQPLEIGQTIYYTTGGTKTTEFGLFVPERALTLI